MNPEAERLRRLIDHSSRYALRLPDGRLFVYPATEKPADFALDMRVPPTRRAELVTVQIGRVRKVCAKRK